MKLSIGGRRGSLMGESCLLQFVGLFVALPCPLLKMLHTLVKHTQFLHRTAVAIFSEGRTQRVSRHVTQTAGFLLIHDLPMSASWLCYKVNPRLCSCSELFPRLLRMFCPPVALQI